MSIPRRNDDPFCRDCGSYPCSCPTVRAPRRPEPDGRVTLEQDVWWSTADGLTILIDDMTNTHRGNVAAMLVRSAQKLYLLHRYHTALNDWMTYVDAGEDADWGPVFDDPPTVGGVRAKIAAGPDSAAVDWLRSTALFRRMVRDIPPEQLRAGVLGADAMREFYTSADSAPSDF